MRKIQNGKKREKIKLGAIQVLRIKRQWGGVGCGGWGMGAGVGVGVSAFPKKNITKVRFNVVSVTRGGCGVKFPEKKRYVTLEWALNSETLKAGE